MHHCFIPENKNNLQSGSECFRCTLRTFSVSFFHAVPYQCFIAHGTYVSKNNIYY